MGINLYGKKLQRMLLAASAIVLMTGLMASAQNANWISSATTDAWAKFGSGSWKTVRIINKSYDENGALTNQGVTITQTEVARVTRRSFSLQVRATMEMMGEQFPSDPQLIERNFAEQTPVTTSIGKEALTIKGQDFPTEVVQTIIDGDNSTRTSTVHFCKLTNPQVLKRVTVAKDPSDDHVKSHTTVTVTELDKTVDVLGELKSCWTVTTVIKVGDITHTTTETHCADVPGELVKRTTEEHNSLGRLVRRSELEIEGYGYGDSSRRRFRRRR
jgi:hypothetical protein